MKFISHDVTSYPDEEEYRKKVQECDKYFRILNARLVTPLENDADSLNGYMESLSQEKSNLKKYVFFSPIKKVNKQIFMQQLIGLGKTESLLRLISRKIQFFMSFIYKYQQQESNGYEANVSDSHTESHDSQHEQDYITQDLKDVVSHVSSQKELYDVVLNTLTSDYKELCYSLENPSIPSDLL